MKLRDMSWIEQILIIAARRARGYHPAVQAFKEAHDPVYTNAKEG